MFGASGGIGSALLSLIAGSGHFAATMGFGRRRAVPIDLTDEASLSRAVAAAVAAGPIRLGIDATGFLHDADGGPEKSWREVDAGRLAHAFAINAIGPALLMKHLLPRLPRTGKAVFATLSARVGADRRQPPRRLVRHRASKAALNQLVRTAAIELVRRAPDAVCLALHPGTVATGLSASFVPAGPRVHTPQAAAAHLLAVLDRAGPDQTGGFLDWRGDPVPW